MMHNIFVDWVKTTLNNGTARFTTNVWLGSSYVHERFSGAKQDSGLSIKSEWPKLVCGRHGRVAKRFGNIL
jgi:hypothetical protein